MKPSQTGSVFVHCNIVKLGRFIYILVFFFFKKTIIALALVGNEMITANSALRASLSFYHFISNARSWNNCLIPHDLQENLC